MERSELQLHKPTDKNLKIGFSLLLNEEYKFSPRTCYVVPIIRSKYSSNALFSNTTKNVIVLWCMGANITYVSESSGHIFKGVQIS